MTAKRLQFIALETALFTGDLASALGLCLLCKIRGHRRDLIWQDMSTGAIGKCPRCEATVVGLGPTG